NSSNPFDFRKHAAQTRRHLYIAEADDRVSCGGDGADLCRDIGAGPSRDPRSAGALLPKHVCLVAAGRARIPDTDFSWWPSHRGCVADQSNRRAHKTLPLELAIRLISN